MAEDPIVLVGRRVSINFIPRVVTELDWLVAHTGVKQNDVANRGVQIYAFVEHEKTKGRHLALVNPDGSVERVNIL